MSTVSLFKKSTASERQQLWHRTLFECGVSHSPRAGDGEPIQSPGLGGALRQMLDDGLAEESGEGFLLTWERQFEALAMQEYEGLSELLELPVQTELRPLLASRGALVDENFSISLDLCVDAEG